MSDDYFAVNRANWDDRAGVHEHSPGYDRERLLSGERELSHVVAFHRPAWVTSAGCARSTCSATSAPTPCRCTGSGRGSSGSTSRLLARRLAADAGADVEYVEADVYSAPSALAGHAPFDLVYTGIGALGWLPSIDRWARTVAALLRPGGWLFIREAHPVLWACDDPRPDGLVVLAYPYVETPEPTVWDDASTYVEPAPGSDGAITVTVTHEWNHGLGEIFTALTRHGMDVVALEEHRTVPYLALGDQMVADPELPGEYRLAEGDDRLPLTYTVQAVRRG